MGTNVQDATVLANALTAMTKRLTALKGLVTTLKTDNDRKQEEIDELHVQLVSGPSAPAQENPYTLTRMLKEVFASEKKAKVPKPHNYDGDRSKLPTFCQEVEAYIINQKPMDNNKTEKVINVITGYLTGNVATWYTIAYAT